MASLDSPSAASFNRGLSDESERQGVEMWRALFPRIERISEKVAGEHVQVVEPRSSMSLDRPYLGRWRDESLHRVAIAAAADALVTLRDQLNDVAQGRNGLPMTGLYPTLRSAMENASLAIYLLEPEARDERLLRSFRSALDDAKWEDTFGQEIGRGDGGAKLARTTEHVHELFALRSSLGRVQDANLRFPGYTQLVKLAYDAISADPAHTGEDAPTLLAWWQLLSGMSHAKPWAMRAALERRDAVVDYVDESVQVRMTSSTVLIAMFLARAVDATETALNLFARRSRYAYAQSEDATEPFVAAPTSSSTDDGVA